MECVLLSNAGCFPVTFIFILLFIYLSPSAAKFRTVGLACFTF